MSRLKVLILILAATGLGLSFWLFQVGAEVEITISRGTPASEVGTILAQKGVLRSPFLFKALARLTGLERSLKPGSYQLRKNMSSLEALWRIHRGGLDFIRVVIPEGWRATQIAARLEDLGVTVGDEFMDFVMENNLEGYLFPTTYFMSANMPAAKVAQIMRGEFLAQVGPLLVGKMHPLLTPESVVTLASVVEREAALAEERPTIARVYLNRLERHWSLEADPTVQYALGYWKKNLRYRDLDVPSPYNTYRNRGLPPGPICSPGLDSIRAVLNPEDTNALYFVADTKGGHVFTSTHREHLKAKKKMKEELRRWKRQKRTPAKK